MKDRNNTNIETIKKIIETIKIINIMKRINNIEKAYKVLMNTFHIFKECLKTNNETDIQEARDNYNLAKLLFRERKYQDLAKLSYLYH